MTTRVRAARPLFGGGLRIESSNDVTVVLNEISNNIARIDGANVYVSYSVALLGRNFVSGGDFTDVSPFDLSQLGGGVCAARNRIELCSNFIYENAGQARRWGLHRLWLRHG